MFNVRYGGVTALAANIRQLRFANWMIYAHFFDFRKFGTH